MTPAQLKVRLSDELRSKVLAAAKASGRSLNAELLHRLEGSFGTHELRMVRGEREARVYVHGDRLLIDVPTVDSPQGLTDMTLHPEDMENVLSFFDLLPAEKP